MDRINWKFSDQFRSHWIKIKFYEEQPKLKDVEKLKKTRFCEATNEAITRPVLLSKTSISCPGARHAFGYENKSIKGCNDKREFKDGIFESMLSKAPVLKKTCEYIGLNTEGEPDILISYLPPEEVMNLIKIYNNHEGKNLDVSLSTMMSVCGGVAVRTFLDEKISFSFGCDDSREFADMRRENLVVGIPKKLFHIFVN
ncbi:MAG: DUF169 domain-containing protein [Candidatus Omnitrophica bacterium]|nr:DUF169 domain-containing protein [Candidatus Omnitrophota bacterium]